MFDRNLRLLLEREAMEHAQSLGLPQLDEDILKELPGVALAYLFTYTRDEATQKLTQSTNILDLADCVTKRIREITLENIPDFLFVNREGKPLTKWDQIELKREVKRRYGRER